MPETNEVEVVPAEKLLSSRTEWVLVDTDEKLQAAIEDLKVATGPFAVDAERASGFKYSQRAYLVQIHRRNSKIYLIDPEAFGFSKERLSTLSQLLKTQDWILHAASQDLSCLRELGLEPVRVLDTELGSRIAGLPRVGLGAVVEHFLQLALAKEHSAVDWSTRPLQNSWLEYAALDVDILPDLWIELDSLLLSQNKLEWAHQEFAATVAMKPKHEKVDKWRSLSGLHEVRDQRGLAIAREVWLAREELARKLDVSPGRLIPDSSVVLLAKQSIKTKPELASSRSFNGRASRSYLDLWWTALKTGMETRDLPVLKLPQMGIPNHRIWVHKYPAADSRLRASKPVMAQLSEEMNIPVENLLTPDFLRQLCWQPPEPNTRENIANQLAELGARAWQIDLVSEKLVAPLAAQLQENADSNENTHENANDK